MMSAKDFSRVLIFSAVILGPMTHAVAADPSYDRISAIMKSKGSTKYNQIGALIGARVHCELDAKPIAEAYSTQLSFTSKTPRDHWDLMLATANGTLADLRGEQVECTEFAKASLMARVQ